MDPVKFIMDHCKILQTEWNRKPRNLEKCVQILEKLKIALTQVPFLPTNKTENTTSTNKELLIARDILEVGAQCSIEVKDIPSFERYMAQLKCYYFDYQRELPESASKYILLGLNLLCLLSQNRVAEFHTELELLPPKEIQTNQFIRHPVSMEQYLMEGSYNKVFSTEVKVPSESYHFFMSILQDTVRNEIAGCIEKAYEKIAVNEARKMLFFKKPSDMDAYSKKRGWKVLMKECYVFSSDKVHSEDSIPAFDLATQAIGYAKELEMIV